MEQQPNLYLAVYQPGPAWLAGQPMSHQPLKEHGRYLLNLYAKGVLKFAGPFSDDTGGASVITARDLDEANALIAADPAVVSQVFVYALHPWALVPWEQHLEAHKKD